MEEFSLVKVLNQKILPATTFDAVEHVLPGREAFGTVNPII